MFKKNVYACTLKIVLKNVCLKDCKFYSNEIDHNTHEKRPRIVILNNWYFLVFLFLLTYSMLFADRFRLLDHLHFFPFSWLASYLVLCIENNLNSSQTHGKIICVYSLIVLETRAHFLYQPVNFWPLWCTFAEECLILLSIKLNIYFTKVIFYIILVDSCYIITKIK